MGSRQHSNDLTLNRTREENGFLFTKERVGERSSGAWHIFSVILRALYFGRRWEASSWIWPMSTIRDAATAVVLQMQRLDAFLLQTLYTNVQRMQGSPPSNSQLDTPFQRTAALNGQPSPWMADGLRRMDLGEPDVVALQIAPWTFITSSYAYSLLAMVGSRAFSRFA